MAVRYSVKRIKHNGGVIGLQDRSKPGGVKVGILKGTGEHPNAKHGQTIAEIAFWNEFGTRGKDGQVRIPERPWMRTTMKANGPEYRRLFKKALQAILLGKISVKRAEARIGLQGQKDLKDAIVKWRHPGNAPSTIAKKGKDNPLEDIGAMRNAIHWASARGVHLA